MDKLKSTLTAGSLIEVEGETGEKVVAEFCGKVCDVTGHIFPQLQTAPLDLDGWQIIHSFVFP